MKLYQAKNYIAIKHFYKKWKWITPDEREEIFDEVAELYAEQKVKNLAQPDVSGNEANPLKLNVTGEVAVCHTCKTKLYEGVMWNWCDKCEKVIGQTDR